VQRDCIGGNERARFEGGGGLDRSYQLLDWVVRGNGREGEVPRTYCV
jgi:hypothetical protein